MCVRYIRILIRISLMSLLIFGVSTISQGKEQLIAVGHRVHETIASGEEGEGKNLIEVFEKEYNVDVIYQTYDVTRIIEKFYFLGPLKSCAEDIIYVGDYTQVKPDMMRFLEPLNSCIKTEPIAGFPEEWPSSLIEMSLVEGSYYLIPIRVGYEGIWYNKKIFDERGIAGPPRTPEEIYEIAKKCTYEKPNGEKIFGFCSRGTALYAVQNMVKLARMWEGDAITPDLKVAFNDAPAIKALELLRRMYQEGIMPPDWHTFTYAEDVKLFQEGRVAMVLEPTNYNSTFNDPKQSKIAGNAFLAPIPLAKEFITSERDFARPITFLWSMGILKGSQKKDLAWKYIRFLSSKDSHLNMALSGNPPARIDILEDPEYARINPNGKIEAKIAPYSRPWIPAFPNVTEVLDIIGEYIHNVIVYGKSLQEEMDEAALKVKSLLP